MNDIPTCTILVAHTNGDWQANADFEQLAATLAERLGQPVIACALDGERSPLANAISLALRGGAVRLVIVPIFLSPAEYQTNAVAEAVSFASRRWPFLQFHLGPPVAWEEWVTLVETAARPALSGVPPLETAVILAARNDTPEVNSDIAKLARLVYEANDFGRVEAVFVGEKARPTLRVALQQLQQLGAQQVTIVPWVMFAGTAVSQIDNAAAGEPGLATTSHLAAQAALLDLLVAQQERALADRSLLPVSWEEVQRQLTAELNTHNKGKPGRPAADEDDFQQLNTKINAILPPRYQERLDEVSSAPMAAADLVYDEDGRVAWDDIFGVADPNNPFCALALAGGPSHRGELLQAVTAEACEQERGRYTAVVAEIERGIQMISGLPTVKSAVPGWVGVQCDSAEMAVWLVRAIIVENVLVRREGDVLYLPASPQFTIKNEIKSIVTVTAKTCHYWVEHMTSRQFAASSA